MVHLASSASSYGGSNAYLPSALSHAFITMSVQDPSDHTWYMDTGATNHIANNPGRLRSLFNKSNLSSVLVGNGSFALVTKTGQTIIPSKTRPLQLNSVLVCPSIIKNMVSVRRFVTDNICTVEFDPFGFSIKDLQIRNNLLRCDSLGPFYIVTPSHGQPQVLSTISTSDTIWYRRLGHPGLSTLKSLFSASVISCNKSD